MTAAAALASAVVLTLSACSRDSGTKEGEADTAARSASVAMPAPNLDPRWSTIDAANLGVAVPKGLPVSLQERAWSSPIWYAPK